MNKIKILYIEDELDQRKPFAEQIAAQGFRVMSTASGEAGLRSFKKNRADVVLCDLNMPKMNGLEVLKKIRQIDEAVPVIILTAHGSVDIAVKALKEGAYDFVLKPPEINKISTTIHKAIENIQLQTQLEQSERELKKYSQELERRVEERTERLEYANRQLIALNEVSNKFSSIHLEKELLKEAPKLLCESLDFDRATFFLNKNGRLALHSLCMAKDSEALIKSFLNRVKTRKFRMPPHFMESIEQNKTIFIPDLNADPRWPKNEPGQPIRTKAVVVSPIKAQKKPIGVIVGNMQYHDRDMDDKDIARFEMFTNMVGFALDNIRSYHTLETKVVERTKELRQANLQLRAKAKESEKKTYSLGKANVELLSVQEELEKKNAERKQAIEALERERNFVSAILDTAGALVVVLDPKGRIVRFNRACEETTGYSFKQVEGEHIWDIFLVPTEILRVRAAFDRLIGGDFPNRTENYWLTKKGEQRLIDWSNTALVDAEGEIEYVISTGIDITERKQAEKTLKETQTQLVQSEKMASLGMLVAGIAHEINTPIGALSSMHDTLKRAVGKLKETLEGDYPKELQENGSLFKPLRVIEDANRVIDNGSERVTTIIRRLRSFARLDEAELKTIDIHEGLEDTLTLIHHEIKYNLKVIKNFGDLPPIACFPGRLNQVYLNLLINAKQAIQDKGEITITTSQKDGNVHIEFKDNGNGIPKDKIEKIFDPGYTTKGVGVGTGLGLSIVYQIIEDHKGSITVESEVGKGTTFTIIFPMNLDELLEKT